jgi:hypothetical protein
MSGQTPEQFLWIAFHSLGDVPLYLRAVSSALGLVFVFLLPKDPGRLVMLARYFLCLGLGLVTFSSANSGLLPFGDCLVYPSGVLWLGLIVRRRWDEIASTAAVQVPAERELFNFLFIRRR